MNKTDDKKGTKQLLLYILFLSILLIAVILTSVSFYRLVDVSKTSPTNEPESNPTKIIKVVYKTGPDIQPSVDKVIPGYKSEIKEFTVNNISDTKVQYNIKWQNVYNNFTSNNLVYYIEINGKEIASGVLPKTDQVILDNVEIEPGSIHYIKAYVEFINQGHEQNEDMNCTFAGVLIVDNV